MKIFVLSKKTGILYALMTLSVFMLILIGRGEVMTVSNTERDLPIYCVDKGENDKVVAMSFDAAWGNSRLRTAYPQAFRLFCLHKNL